MPAFFLEKTFCGDSFGRIISLKADQNTLIANTEVVVTPPTNRGTSWKCWTECTVTLTGPVFRSNRISAQSPKPRFRTTGHCKIHTTLKALTKLQQTTFCFVFITKQAYLNILRILLPKIWTFQIKIWYVSYFYSKRRLWVLVRTAVLTSTQNLCFWAEIRKIMYTPDNPSLTIYKSGV